MHNQRGRPFEDTIADICDGLNESLALAADAGVARDMLIIDPGFGFGWTAAADREKNVARDLEILRRLDELHDLGLPVLVGPSR
jgi:dihydropteroate synthase